MQYYTSPELALDLLRRGVYTCGALSKRRGWPHKLMQAKSGAQGASGVMTLGRLSIVGVADAGLSAMLSTIHSTKRVGTVRRWDPHQAVNRLYQTYAHQQDYGNNKGVVDGWHSHQVRRVSGGGAWAVCSPAPSTGQIRLTAQLQRQVVALHVLVRVLPLHVDVLQARVE